MKRLLTILGVSFLALNACSSDDKKDDGNVITTEPVITKQIVNLFAGGPFGQETPTAYFSIETGKEVPASDVSEKNWDISFKRAEIKLNGGISGSGNAAAVISNLSFNEIEIAPEEGYIKDGEGPNEETGLDIPSGLAFTNWFTYSNEQHGVQPKDQVYIIRTANNKYAKLKILSYYSDSTPSISASYTFDYTFQPGGSKVLK